MTLTVVALDHITLRWEEPIDPKLALAVGVITNEHMEQAAPELDKAMNDLMLFGSCQTMQSMDDGRLITKHIPPNEWRAFCDE